MADKVLRMGFAPPGSLISQLGIKGDIGPSIVL